MSKNEAETRYELIDPVLRRKGYRVPYIQLETPAPVEPIGPKGRRRRGPGKTDYLLCIEVPNGLKPLPIAILEAKRENEDPPFGGKEGKDAQKNYAFATGSTQVLFVQDILGELDADGRCAIVLDDGFLFRKDEDAFVETKRKLVDECDLWAIISLPGGVFSGAGAGIKTNLLFFTKGRKTSKIWYYDFTHLKVGKTSPMTLAHFGFGKNGEILDDSELPVSLTEAWLGEDANKGKPFPSYARLLPKRGTANAESPYSWTVDFAARRKQAREEMQPHIAKAELIKAAIVSLKEKLKALRRTDAKADAIEQLETKIKEQEKAARDSQSKADAIGATVFDLKAVNPNVVVKLDTRTPAEVIQSIEEQGKIVAQSLETLRILLGVEVA